MLIKNRQLGIRIPDNQLKEYTELCSKLNSIMSLRIRKFIETELQYNKDGKDLLVEIEKKNKSNEKK